MPLTLSDVIKRRMAAANIGQHKLAKLMGVDVHILSKFMQDELDYEDIFKQASIALDQLEEDTP